MKMGLYAYAILLVTVTVMIQEREREREKRDREREREREEWLRKLRKFGCSSRLFVIRELISSKVFVRRCDKSY